MPEYEFNSVLNGSANGANTFALQNPENGTPPSFDETLSLSLPLANATGIFTGNADNILVVDFDVTGTYLTDVTKNADLNKLYTSSPGNSLYDLVTAAARAEAMTVVVSSETPTETTVTDVESLNIVLDKVVSETALLSLIREQLYTNDGSNRWVDSGSGGAYQNVPKVGDILNFYVTYTVNVTSKYALDGVGEGATITYFDGTQNVTAVANTLTVGTTPAARTFKVSITVVENPAPPS